MDSTLFDFGIIKIKWYSFFIFLAILVAYLLISKEAKKKKLPDNYLSDIIFYGIIISILGARLYYVLFNINYYLSNPIEIFMIWHGGLAIHGGIIAGFVFLICYTKKKKINLFLLLDIIVVGLIIAQAIGRWGNFFNSEAYGRITTLTSLKKLHIPQFVIKGMYIDGLYREPTFLYESVLSFIGFIVLLLIRKTKKLKTGMLTSMYTVWYGIERFIIESMRSDSLMLGTIKIAQLVSIIAIIFGIWLFIKSLKDNKYYYKDKILYGGK